MSVESESASRARSADHAEAQVIDLWRAKEGFFDREVWYRDLLNALPAAIYTTDAEGRITFYNEAAVQFAGRRPALGELWCVTWRLFNVDGSPLPHDECPMAIAIRERRPVRGAEAVAERPDGSRITFTPYPTPILDAGGRLLGAVNMLVDITERNAAEERQRLLANEVNHRANNLLTVVQSVIRLTKGGTVKDYREALEGRVQALARAHGLLARTRWLAADLQHLVSEELAPYMGGDARAWLSGAPLPLQPAAAQSVALIVHELATNAAKYGALSTPKGRVTLQWSQTQTEIAIRWSEEGGPAVGRPRRRGVGSTVIERAAAQLGGRVTFDWGPAGLTCELRVPLDNLAREDAA